MIVLDTNVISEFMRQEPDAAVLHFVTMTTARRKAGMIAQPNDMMIAAIALAHDADAVVTRNTYDFVGCGLPLINSWDA